ncbi:MAG: hypothetical protein ACM3S5_17210 [Rhodospirillales bacterium]
MLTLFLAVEAKPGENVVFEGAAVEGYYQTFGVTARNEDQLRSLVEEYLKSDLEDTLIEISERWEPDFSGGYANVRDEVGDISKVGIWYRSGRAWFGPDDPGAVEGS